MLREACRQNAEWQKAGLRSLRVAVNLSARQFSSAGLLDEIDAAAEGVETEQQLKLLESLGCDQIQGYFFSRPLSAEDFLSYYRAHI